MSLKPPNTLWSQSLNRQYRRLRYQRNELWKLSYILSKLEEVVVIIDNEIKAFIKSFDEFNKIIINLLDQTDEKDSLSN